MMIWRWYKIASSLDITPNWKNKALSQPAGGSPEGIKKEAVK